MRYFLLFVFTSFFFSCTSHTFDADMRQIAAKNEIAGKIAKGRQFNVIAFAQDTVINYPDSLIKSPIRYSLDVTFKDSMNYEQKRKGVVYFTHDGNSIIKSMIADSVH